MVDRRFTCRAPTTTIEQPTRHAQLVIAWLQDENCHIRRAAWSFARVSCCLRFLLATVHIMDVRILPPRDLMLDTFNPSTAQRAPLGSFEVLPHALPTERCMSTRTYCGVRSCLVADRTPIIVLVLSRLCIVLVVVEFSVAFLFYFVGVITTGVVLVAFVLLFRRLQLRRVRDELLDRNIVMKQATRA